MWTGYRTNCLTAIAGLNKDRADLADVYGIATALLRNSGLRHECPFPLSLMPRERYRPFRGAINGSSVRCRFGFRRFGDPGLLTRCVHRRLSGSASSLRCGFGCGILSIASRTPDRSAGGRGGFRCGRLPPAVLLPLSAVFPDRDDRGDLTLDDGGVAAAGVIGAVGCYSAMPSP